MRLFDIFKKKQTVDLERQRREYLMKNGRITDGTIIENDNEEITAMVSYIYTVHGADYESSELLSEEQLSNSLKYAPGAKVGVRYDPKQHGNSMLV